MCIVGWGNTPTEASFGGGGNDAASVKGKLVNLISSVRTLMRSEFACSCFYFRFVEGGRGVLSLVVEVWVRVMRLGKGGFFVVGRLLTGFWGMVVPLIVINTLVIVYELVLG